MTTHRPAGFHDLTPYLVVDDGDEALQFYAAAFGATEVSVRRGNNGRLQHAELMIGDSPIMLAEPFELGEVVATSPRAAGATSVHAYLYVPDADAALRQALAAGARELLPVSRQPYGERSGGVIDPFGHVWWLATRIA